MDKKLRQFAEMVWNLSQKGQKPIDVYGLYCESEKKLWRSIGKEEHAQNMRELGRDFKKLLDVQLTKEQKRTLSGRGPALQQSPHQSKGWFYFFNLHYYGTLTAPGITHRAYINSTSRQVKKLIETIMVNLVLSGTAKSGVAQFKTADDPHSIDERLDAVVVYGTQAGIKGLVTVLRYVQAKDKNLFRPGIPRLTEPVPGVFGVGVAMEPPSDARNPQSFGTLSSSAIEAAAKEAQRTHVKDLEAFLKLVEMHYRQAGFDPNNSHMLSKK